MVFSSLQTDRTDLKLADITSAVLKELDDQCHCQIPSNTINDESFACFDDSANYVTYRARLRGTSAVNGTSLFSLIENWATSGPAIRVRGVLMRVDTQCSVAISNFNDEECTAPTVGSTNTTAATDMTEATGSTRAVQSGNTPAIVGGVVAVVTVLTVTVGIIAVVALVVRSRHREISFKKTEQ